MIVVSNSTPLIYLAAIGRFDVGVLMAARSQGHVAALKPELDKLRACGFRLSDRLYRLCLAAIGE